MNEDPTIVPRLDCGEEITVARLVTTVGDILVLYGIDEQEARGYATDHLGGEYEYTVDDIMVHAVARSLLRDFPCLSENDGLGQRFVSDLYRELEGHVQIPVDAVLSGVAGVFQQCGMSMDPDVTSFIDRFLVAPEVVHRMRNGNLGMYVMLSLIGGIKQVVLRKYARLYDDFAYEQIYKRSVGMLVFQLRRCFGV